MRCSFSSSGFWNNHNTQQNASKPHAPQTHNNIHNKGGFPFLDLIPLLNSDFPLISNKFSIFSNSFLIFEPSNFWNLGAPSVGIPEWSTVLHLLPKFKLDPSLRRTRICLAVDVVAHACTSRKIWSKNRFSLFRSPSDSIPAPPHDESHAQPLAPSWSPAFSP